MLIPIVRNFNGGKKVLLACAGALVVAAINAQTRDQVPTAQSPAAPQWQIAAGSKMAFEVASVKRGTFVPPSFPLDGSDAFTPTGGRFLANFPLVTYIMFAYKVYPAPDQRQAMVARLPAWVNTDRFTIEAKAEGNPTKDQFRLMMQSLLSDRFKVAIHFEIQQGPMFALTLVKPGKLGPRLRPHDEGPPCDAPAAPPAGGADGWPPTCASYGVGLAPDRTHLRGGWRNTTMADLAQALASTGTATLPVVDRTGLSGRYDLLIEYTPESTDAAGTNLLTIMGVQPDPQGPTYLDAMRDQLGLKLESIKGPIQVLVIDHVETPTEN